MIWNQTYLLFGQGLGLSLAIAVLPILTLLLLLGGLRRPAWQAGLAGLGVTFAIALGGYHMPVRQAVSAALLGAAFGLFPISWIVLWAITLFRVTVEAGQFEIIKNSIGRLTPDPRLQALLVAFAFGAFLEGASGFGTPVAIASTMLIGLGFSPFRASALCLLANTAPVAFGSIGIPLFTLAGTTGLPLSKLSAAVGALCSPISLIVPTYLMLAVGGGETMGGIWLPALLAGGVFGGVQLLVSTLLGPQLTDILAALAALSALVLLLRLRGDPAAATSPALLKRFARGSVDEDEGIESTMAETALPTYPLRTVLHAWMPYGLLVLCVLLWGWAPFQVLLNKPTIPVLWPGLHDMVRRMPPITLAPSPYHAVFTVNWLSAAGTACMVATLLSAALLGLRPGQFLRLFRDVLLQLRWPTLTVTSVLAMAFLMNYSGATATLGLAFAATGALFPFFSALLGWIGVFLTGSDTSANALFGNLQVVTAERLHLSPVLLAATNSAGGVMGKMISLQTIAVAAASTNLSGGQQAKLFRFTLRHSVILAVFVGLVALLYAHLPHFQ